MNEIAISALPPHHNSQSQGTSRGATLLLPVHQPISQNVVTPAGGSDVGTQRETDITSASNFQLGMPASVLLIHYGPVPWSTHEKVVAATERVPYKIVSMETQLDYSSVSQEIAQADIIVIICPQADQKTIHLHWTEIRRYNSGAQCGQWDPRGRSAGLRQKIQNLYSLLPRERVVRSQGKITASAIGEVEIVSPINLLVLDGEGKVDVEASNAGLRQMGYYCAMRDSGAGRKRLALLKC